MDPIAEFVDPTPEQLRAAWDSVLLREEPGVSRQVNFIPCEVVLCLCASLFVDHSKFGSSSAHRAPALVLNLARLFKRPPSSILAKMANLDGTRPNGGRHDREVADRLLPAPDDWQQLHRVYRKIIRAAREAGIGPDRLMDFWDPLTTPSKSGKGTVPVATENPEQVTGDIRWFDGVNGQIILEDQYVWIIRDELGADCRWDLPTKPRRALRSALVECQLQPATEDEQGTIHLRVQGAAPAPAPADCEHDENAVTFDWARSNDFEELYGLLVEADEVGRSPMETQFVVALDSLSGVATLPELVIEMMAQAGTAPTDEAIQQLTADLEEFDNDEFSTWQAFHPRNGDEVWVAAGGRNPMGVGFRDARLAALNRVTTVLRMDSTQEDVLRAAKRVGLRGLSPDRLMSLWTALASGPEAPPKSVASPTRTISAPPRVRLPSSTPARPAPNKPQPKIMDAIAQPTLHIRKLTSPAIGEDFRVHMLCDGLETIARYYSRTSQVRIVRGTLKGQEFPDPHAAAAAVMERDIPGHDGTPDGWTVWRLKGGPDLPLGSVLKRL